MAKVDREALYRRMFADPKNYPYGFARSGDFSINESKALSQFGCVIAALVDGQLQPSTDEEHGFLAAAFEQRPPETPAERAWLKYQKRINRPKLGSIYGTKSAVIDDDGDAGISDDSDLEIVVDD
ncbi:DUF413 domain-containing protein [Aestuariibacter salexigens]|uniref:DUF413 domain-containing protein n=1 Tax=Aestuariibacter salexigens TaxID=226010 RepID=UPI00041B547C|nr:DUF413 domain-containing protein [Aestuariibacter salexigens]